MSSLSFARPARHPSLAKRLMARLALASALHQQRAALARLDPHLLDDIGLTRPQALSEAARPLWDAPDHWRL